MTSTHLDSPDDDVLLDVDSLAHRLAVSPRFVRRLVEERRIRFLKIGRHVRFDPADVERWIEAQRVEQANPF
ncbi:MAG: helix-turn-helix domain-containing protein [Actinomycetota bacterium]